jgi:enoyl-[acyl-carrier protein] reductase I
MSFLNLENKRFLVAGVANRKSVAYHVAKILLEEKAEVLLSVRDESTKSTVEKFLPACPAYICDVENEQEIVELARSIEKNHGKLDGLVHSLAFANFSEGLKPFHETVKKDFLQAVDISMFSLISLSNHLKGLFNPDASVITISISTTRMASENYGYMAPVKAALDSAVCFLAKSFSAFSRVRFNSVNPGLLKTSASAGIPGYLDNFLFAEKVIPRGEAVKTEEAASVVAFLLSERSSGINAQGVVVDAGMSINYFDHEIVRRATRLE